MRRKKKKSLAARADRYDLYQRSVQNPGYEVDFFRRVFMKRYGRPPRTLREDFCGTGLLSATWAAAHRENHAVGFDIDPEPLAWGREHNLAPLSPAARRRVRLLRGNALSVRRPKADIVTALNFSYFTFKTRDRLRDYFRTARRNLRRDGLFILDMTGGPDSWIPMEDPRRFRGFTYRWVQESIDPITHDCRCAITFEFSDRSRLARAFTYEWRLWTIPEVRELLAEAGFQKSIVYWEGFDEKGEGNGVFRERERAPNCDCDSWVVFIAAVP